MRVAAGVRARAVGIEVGDDPEPHATRLGVVREPPNDRDAGALVAVDGADHEHASGRRPQWPRRRAMMGVPQHGVTREPGGRRRLTGLADRCREDRHRASMAETS